MAVDEKNKKHGPEDEDSDVDLEGMDLDGDDEEMEETVDDDDSPDYADEAAAGNEEAIDKLATEDHDELEAAKRERMELMESERKQVIAPDSTSASASEQLQYLLAQSEVFAHFLAGEQ